MGSPTVTILVTTKNRKDELGVALDSCVNQAGVNEVFVLDDGSDDGTYEYVQENYPSIRIERQEESLGVIRARNYGVERAKSDVVITIDDDCVFQNNDVIGKLVEELYEDDRVWAVTIPSIDVKINPDRVIQKSPGEDAIYLGSAYRGGCHAVKRELFVGNGSYYGEMVRQGEESDICMRMIGKGYFVRLGNSGMLHHYESPVRNYKVIAHYNVRSNMLVMWRNIPMPIYMVHGLVTLLNLLKFCVKKKQFKSFFTGLFSSLGVILSGKAGRQSMTIQHYHLFEAIKRGKVKTLDEAVAWLEH
ncbi:N-glycosyltransferase [Poriferisphaera corsica]|uniref:N-glycosyltransferase n=1 Tax=Poriferisphaera corsica TaxID=2528020 RepID=A0A517YQ09_9BACT|nr:glycosyltransferase family 2 protein [Poriferisphaera corsica]QDU32291.1 N-glycosyltransferase [Poriferisphaera corsica]